MIFLDKQVGCHVSSLTMKLNAQRLKRLRQIKGMTQIDLSRKIKKHSSTISLLEAGKINGLPPTIKRISAALGVSLEELLEGEATARPSNAG